MRYALPLIYCVDEETQANLLGMITDINSVPRCEWVEWPAFEVTITPLDLRSVEEAEMYYNKFMRQAPSRSRH